mgnify:CR=1 FL=1
MRRPFPDADETRDFGDADVGMGDAQFLDALGGDHVQELPRHEALERRDDRSLVAGEQRGDARPSLARRDRVAALLVVQLREALLELDLRLGVGLGLDFLFEALKIAPDADSAKHIENRIWALWIASGSDTANLMMGRVKEAIDGKDVDLAIKLLDALIELRPEYVEAWNRRATLYYLRKDYVRAMADIRQADGFLAKVPARFQIVFDASGQTPGS